MKNMKLNTKSKEIKEIVSVILDKIDRSSIEVVDYWDSDLCAIGFKILKKEDRLLYISTYKKKKNEYYYEIEGKLDSSKVEVSGNANMADLLKIISQII